MNPPLYIDGVRCETEAAVRNFAFDISEKGKPFKQDFRIASKAHSLPFIQLIELLDSTGHDVQQAGI